MSRIPPAQQDAGDPASVSETTLRALGDELIRLGRRRDTGDAAMTLDGSAYKILWLVVEHGPHTLRDLARGLQLEQSTINRQVHAVIGHGLVERYSDPDSVALLIRATEAGEAAYRQDAAVRAAGLRSVLEVMGERSAAELAVGLAAFNDAIDVVAEQTPLG